MADQNRRQAVERRGAVRRRRAERTSHDLRLTAQQQPIGVVISVCQRSHRNGVRAEVHAHPRLTYTVLAIGTDGWRDELHTRGTMADAQGHADGLSRCPQPCDCPHWTHGGDADSAHAPAAFQDPLPL